MSISAAKASLGPYRSRLLWFAAVSMLVIGVATAIAAAVGWQESASAGTATLLAGVAALLLVVFRRIGVVLRELREHDSRLSRYQQAEERMMLALHETAQALDVLHSDLLGSEGRLLRLERRLLAEVGSLDEMVSGLRETVDAEAKVLDGLSTSLGIVAWRSEATRDTIEQVRATQDRAMTRLTRLRADVRSSVTELDGRP